MPFPVPFRLNGSAQGRLLQLFCATCCAAQLVARPGNSQPLPPSTGPAPSAQGAESPATQSRMTVRGRHRSGYQVREATTATKTSTSLLEIPQSIQVIPRQILEDQQAADIADVLDNVSGVQRTGFDDTGVVPQFTVRGFDLNPQTNYYRDGRPMVLAVPPPTSMMEKVEFVKGPSSALYGQAQPGGMVNMVLKRPGRRLQLRSSTRLGSYYHLTQDLDIGGPLTDTLGLRLLGEYRAADSFRDFGRDRGLLGGGVLRWKPSRPWTVNVAAHRQRWQQAADSMLISGPPASADQSFGNRVVDVPISRSLNEPWTHIHVDSDWATYDVTYRPSPQLELSHSVGYQHQENDELRADPAAVQRAIPSLGLVVGNTQKDQRSRNTQARTLSADLRAEWQSQWGPMQQRLLAGVDVRQSVEGFTELTPHTTAVEQFNVFEPVYRPPHPSLGYRPLLLSRASLGEVGAYLQNQVTAWEDLHVLYSLRWTGYQQSSERSRFDAAAFVLEDQTGSQWVQRLGLSFEALEETSFFSSYSGGFRPNQVPFGGALVAPETSGQWEAGLKTFLFEGFVHATVSAYALTKRNVLVDNPVTGETSSDGEHRSRGLELDLVGDLAPGLNVLANYSLMDAIVAAGAAPAIAGSGTTISDLTGNTKVASPRHSGRLWMTYRLPQHLFGPLKIGAGITARSLIQGDALNTIQHPAAAYADAMLAYSQPLSNASLRFQLNVKNATNSIYYHSKVRQRIAPSAPRTVFATLAVEFSPSRVRKGSP